MKKLIGVVIVLFIAILMALTVPDMDAHKKAMMKAITEYVDEEAANKGIPDNPLTRFAKKTVTKAIEHVLSSKLEESNYLIFNTTHIEMEDETNKLLSLGMFGHVFTFNKDMLREALEKMDEEKAEAKAAKKREKAEAKAKKKREKEEAKAKKKREKEEAKAEKKREKAEKKREKEEAKAEKKREKEEAKAEKKRLKEQEKAEKEHLRAMEKQKHDSQK